MAWFFQGGWPMYPLLAVSIISLGVMLDRFLYYLLTWEKSEGVNKWLQTMKVHSRAQESLGSVRKSAKPLRTLAMVFLQGADWEDALLARELRIKARVLQVSYRSRLGILAIIAHLSPLMGLFGTVLGMIEVFQGIAQTGGQASMAVLASGIWMALMTTAFGIGIAVPTMAAHHALESVLERRLGVMETYVDELCHHFKRNLGVNLGGTAKVGDTQEAVYDSLHSA